MGIKIMYYKTATDGVEMSVAVYLSDLYCPKAAIWESGFGREPVCAGAQITYGGGQFV